MTPLEATKFFAKYLVNACPDCAAQEGELCHSPAVWIHLSRFMLINMRNDDD